MRTRIFFKLLAAFLLVIAAVTIILDLSVRRAWERSLREEIERALSQKTRLFAQRVQAEPSRPLAELTRQLATAAEARATVIDKDGNVLADSEADPAHMENHATRPEFAAALAGHQGSSVRFSHTVHVDFLYVAVPIAGGAVRLAYPLSAIQKTTAEVRRALLRASLAALLIATLLAVFFAQSISSRLRRIVHFADRVADGDLSARIAENASDEIAQVASALDKTARRLEETFSAVENARQELETLLNSIEDAVVAVSPGRKVQWANRSMQKLLPVRFGAPMVETIRDPDLLSALQGPLEAHQVRAARVTSMIPGRTFAVTAAPMPGGGAVAVLHDLTDLERTEKMRRDFIANVSHELRTPLTSIQGYAETLLESVPGSDGASREFLEIIRKNAARMARLTEDLLVLARVESGEQRLDLHHVPASDLLDDAVATLSALVRSNGLELQVAEETTRLVRADRDAIHQVFANLADNAVKYAAAGGRIALGARDAGDSVEFFVRDFGPGIPSQHLSRLFERFYRVDTARSREAGGTGLGLAIVKHIVLKHGGSVRAESRLQQGSIFFFTLPAVDR